jgi:hypothetical protein
MSQSCDTCRFFERREQGKGAGWCHRYPPIAFTDGDDHYSGFPTIKDDEWCGEHQTEPKPARRHEPTK